MTPAQQAIDSALQEADKLKKLIAKGKSKQVTADDDRAVIKATALAWFNNHRQIVVASLGPDALVDIDDVHKQLIASSGRASTRDLLVDRVKKLKGHLSGILSNYALALAASSGSPSTSTSDSAPDFSQLVSDPAMRGILSNRWEECIKCVKAEAPLAATVMMGGLLEALLLAKINQLPDKSVVINAKAAPKDKKTNKTQNLTSWGLADYIAVAHELKWISATTKDLGGVLREYRNFVHPQKEHSHGVSLRSSDAQTLWDVAKSISRQIL
jgi:hypothetical protein